MVERTDNSKLNAYKNKEPFSIKTKMSIKQSNNVVISPTSLGSQGGTVK